MARKKGAPARRKRAAPHDDQVDVPARAASARKVSASKRCCLLGCDPSSNANHWLLFTLELDTVAWPSDGNVCGQECDISLETTSPSDTRLTITGEQPCSWQLQVDSQTWTDVSGTDLRAFCAALHACSAMLCLGTVHGLPRAAVAAVPALAACSSPTGSRGPQLGVFVSAQALKGGIGARAGAFVRDMLHAAHAADWAEPAATAAGARVSAEGLSSHDCAWIYSAIKPSGSEPPLEADPPGLVPTLRPFQRRSVRWMLRRERAFGEESEAADDGHQASCSSSPSREAPTAHPQWRRVPAVDCAGGGAVGALFLDLVTGRLALQPPAPPPHVSGGCLCEEMGLGKTVEVIACMLAHPHPSPAAAPSFQERVDALPASPDDPCGVCSEFCRRGGVQCAGCQSRMHADCVHGGAATSDNDTPTTRSRRSKPTGRAVLCGRCLRALADARLGGTSRATLIVCPAAIQQQWFDELRRHTAAGALRVVSYRGQAASLQSSLQGDVVCAADLAAADVVLTTYDCLRHDVYHEADADGAVAAAAQRSRRVDRRYHVMPTPLTRLTWWRVVLDEAQMIEGAVTKAAQMALHLSTVHRWCVTGTPIRRGLEDVYGLLNFLQAEPWNERRVWRQMVSDPVDRGDVAAAEALLRVLQPTSGGLMWRTAKDDVMADLGLAAQTANVRTLALGDVERHFYNRCHMECAASARDLLPVSVITAVAHAGALDPALDRALTAQEADALHAPLLRLRKACCHPQVGAGAAEGRLGAHRAPQSMAEVLTALLRKDRGDAEEAQRALMAALNGLAGCALLRGGAVAAVALYREVLDTARQRTGVCDVDKLQQLHAMVNLGDILGPDGTAVPGVDATPAERNLRADADALKAEYLANSFGLLLEQEAEYIDAVRPVNQTRSDRIARLERHAALAASSSGQGASDDADVSFEALNGWWAELLMHCQRLAAQSVVMVSVAGESEAMAAADWAAELLGRITARINEATSSTYQNRAAANVLTIVDKFQSFASLAKLLDSHARDLHVTQKKVLDELDALSSSCERPPEALYRQAGCCSTCRQETSVKGIVCRHCVLEMQITRWEVKLFRLSATALHSGARVNEDDVIEQYHALKVARIGLGGLGEEHDQAGDSIAVSAGAVKRSRKGTSVTTALLTKHDSQQHTVLAFLVQLLKRSSAFPGMSDNTRQRLLAEGSRHLKWLAASQQLYGKAVRLSLRQRHHLYAHDELAMCTTRFCLVGPDTQLSDDMAPFCVLPHEIDDKVHILESEKVAAEDDLRATLGRLRYGLNLQSAMDERAKLAAASVPAPLAAGDAREATPPAQQPPAEGEAAVGAEELADTCPVCREPLRAGCMMLPCLHRLCFGCHKALAAKLPRRPPRAAVALECPTCRAKNPVSDAMYVSSTRSEAPPVPPRRSRPVLEVGSYGTKLDAIVQCVDDILEASPEDKILIFSTWVDVLDLLRHAFQAYSIPFVYGKGKAGLQAALLEFRSGAAGGVVPVASADAGQALWGRRSRGKGAPAAEGPTAASDGPAAPAAVATALETDAARPPACSDADAEEAGPSEPVLERPAPYRNAPRVLLLPLNQAGAGLNLTEAQHAILVEPTTNPAMEAQAISRVHRIGQTRATHVHRFVVERSVEASLHRLTAQKAARMDMSVAISSKLPADEPLTLNDVAVMLFQERLT